MDETQLTARLCSGDMSALEVLYRAHHAELCRYAAHALGSDALAEEVVEDVFVRIWEKRRQLGVRTSMRAYLFGAVRREALMQHRTEWNRLRLMRNALATGERPGAPSSPASPEQELDAAELAGVFRQVIDGLPARAREAFELKRSHGLSHAEIADAMGISTSTVEKHLARCMEELRSALDRWRSDG